MVMVAMVVSRAAAVMAVPVSTVLMVTMVLLQASPVLRARPAVVVVAAVLVAPVVRRVRPEVSLEMRVLPVPMVMVAMVVSRAAAVMAVPVSTVLMVRTG